MDIPVGAKVHCTDGLCGRSTYVLIDPVCNEVTHLVVKEDESPHRERLVPIDAVTETAPDVILLRYTRDLLDKMDPFIDTEYIREKMPDLTDMPSGYAGIGTYMLWPYQVPDKEYLVAVEHQQVPPGELAIKRGTRVEASDGRVGRVDEFLVNPENEHITHLVMREGHLWGKKDVAIPLSAIAHIDEDTVHLKLSKDEIEALPAVPAHRWGG